MILTPLSLCRVVFAFGGGLPPLSFSPSGGCAHKKASRCAHTNHHTLNIALNQVSISSSSSLFHQQEGIILVFYYGSQTTIPLALALDFCHCLPNLSNFPDISVGHVLEEVYMH